MKKSKFTDSQILAILRQAEQGIPVPELCREHGMRGAAFYKWRAKYGGMDARPWPGSMNWKRKTGACRRYIEECLKTDIVQDALYKKGGDAISTEGDRAQLHRGKTFVFSGKRISLVE